MNDPGTQGFDLLMKGGPFTKPDSDWSTPQHRVGPPPLTVPSQVIQPGQTIKMTFRTEDKAVEPWALDHVGVMPSDAGTYRLYYRLGGFVEFEVGEPILETGTLVPLHKFKAYTDDYGKRISSQRAAVLVAIQLGKEHVLAISGHDMPASHTIDTDSEGVVTDGIINRLCPWIRLATIPFKVTSLKVTVSPTDLISIDYAGADGARGTLHLDVNRHPIN